MSHSYGSDRAVNFDEVLRWLMCDSREELHVDALFVNFCVRMVSAGIPLARASLHFRTNNPEWLGMRILWHDGDPAPEVERVAYEVEKTSAFFKSPFRTIIEGADSVRRRLTDDAWEFDFPLYAELRDQGYTDYVALPLDHTAGRRHLVTFSSSDPSGFDARHITQLHSTLPALSLVTEIRLKSDLAKTLLDTYVGPRAGSQILEGATRRGSGVDIDAGILMCDLRNFTALSNKLPRDEIIELLNGYFDAVTGPINANGGEILKFMGDGILAIFPIGRSEVYDAITRTICGAGLALAELNEQRRLSGRLTFRFGMGVHVGNVMYGNIGSTNRLDFTVIGPAVNIASRLEGMTKVLDRPVLCSGEFAALADDSGQIEFMGEHQLRGFDAPVSVYALSMQERDTKY